MDNTLYYGDNLDVLKRHIADESIDLIYLDPPFNSNANYNVLFEDHVGEKSTAQLQAFKDTWTWAEAALTYQELSLSPTPLGDAMRAFGSLMNKGGMLAYLTMMAPRLSELHRVLKPTGTIYLHCDTTASHYLKVVMDTIFGVLNYRNEISWRRSNPKSHMSINFTNCRDIILRYAKSNKAVFNPIYTEHDPEYVEKAYKYRDDKGRPYRLLPLLNPNDNRPNLTYEFLGVTRVWRWTKDRMQKAYEDGLVVQLKPGAVPQYIKLLEDSKGRTATDDWDDIPQAAGKESLGYPTQKPEALLERIILASSNEGDTVLDPFCGCGTAISVSQRLQRRWIGIDITQAAIQTIKKRMIDTFGSLACSTVGEPTSTNDAEQLAHDDPYQFQWWSLGLVGARPVEGKKGADHGIDGRLYFKDDPNQPPKLVVISVKGGHTNVTHVRDLKGVVERDKASIGVLISMQEPTAPMKAEAGIAGVYHSPWGDFPKVQLLTIEDLLSGKKIEMPQTAGVNITFKQAPKSKKKGGTQGELGMS